MSTLKTGALRGTSGTADSIQLHASNQSVTFPGNVTCSGTATGFGGGNVKYTKSSRIDLNGTNIAEFTVPSNCFKLWLTIRNMSTASTSNKALTLRVGGSYVTSGYRSGAGYIETNADPSIATETNDGWWHFNRNLAGAGHTINGIFEMAEMDTNAWHHSWISDGGNAGLMGVSAGYVGLSGELDALKVTSSSGNFDDGAIIAHFLELV